MWSQKSSRVGGGPSKITSPPTCMCEARRSWWRNDASIGLRRSRWPCFSAIDARLSAMRPLSLAISVVAVTAVVLACSDAPDAARAPHKGRFNGAAAWRLLEWQVELGPRPAGSPASRRLARRLKRLLPHGHYERVPGGLHNVVGTIPGRSRRYVVVGAHYDTKDLPGFVGANDGASGTAVLTQLARTIKPHKLRRSLVFLALDGEEAPAGIPDDEFLEGGVRGAKVAAPIYRRARAMILLDFVGNK